MYAIVEIAGQQFKVEEGKKIFVHRLAAENGKKVEFDQVLLIEDKDKVIVGEPVIKDALIEGKVLEHLKGDKVIVFKKKRKKGYRVKNGHRQYFTQVEIVSIKEKAVRKPAGKKEEVVEEVKAEEVKAPKAEPAAGKTRAPKASEGEGKAKKAAAPKEPSKPKASAGKAKKTEK